MAKVVEFVVNFLFAAALSALVMMLLWNWLAPELFGLKTINFWQALGLVALKTVVVSAPTFKIRIG